LATAEADKKAGKKEKFVKVKKPKADKKNKQLTRPLLLLLKKRLNWKKLNKRCQLRLRKKNHLFPSRGKLTTRKIFLESHHSSQLVDS